MDYTDRSIDARKQQEERRALLARREAQIRKERCRETRPMEPFKGYPPRSDEQVKAVLGDK